MRLLLLLVTSYYVASTRRGYPFLSRIGWKSCLVVLIVTNVVVGVAANG
jgi:hypothetical protein